jgi:DNA-binding LacI/PurR family transcriptional regulator/DNA-binding transcriptional regulator YhcF (GntR family)
MSKLIFLSKIEQLAAHLRLELEGGRWEGSMPGRLELAAELGLNERTVEEALRLLERQGVLIPQGAGRRRLIALDEKPEKAVLRVKILAYEPSDWCRELFVDLLHRLKVQGCDAAFAEKSLHDLGMDVKRVAAHVKASVADVWLVISGSREILEWFAAQPAPCFAISGRWVGLPIAAVTAQKIPAMRAAVRRLHGYGHRRIVFISREERRKPYPAPLEQAFLDELTALGITTGTYNLPDWGDDIAGFYRGLDSLFQHTPPTALFLMEARLYIAAQQHLSRRGIIAPRDVSLICDDPDVAFSWCLPVVSCFHWDTRPVVNRVVRWVDNVAQGKEDRRQSSVKAEFVEGGTIGPAKKLRDS